jgi:hypothetical protein
MKKILFLFLLASAIGLSVNAQVSKGLMTVGGDVSVQNTSVSGGGSSNSTSFSPSFAYFLSDKIAVGGALGITSNSTTGSPSTTTTSVTPFVRFYKFTSEGKFGFFAQGGLGFSTTTGQNTVVTLSVRPGFVYFFTPHWGLDFILPGLAYSSGNNTTTFGLTASLSPSLGFRYYFGGK